MEQLLPSSSDLLNSHFDSASEAKSPQRQRKKGYMQTYVGLAVRDEVRCRSAVEEGYKLV